MPIMIITRESIQALMPNQTLTKIHGKPMHKAVRGLKKELGANLIAVDCPWGLTKGHLGKLQDAVTFLACNGAAYTPPAQAPPPYLAIPLGSTAAERERLKAENQTALGHWQTRQHVRRIAINQVTEAIEPVYYAELNDPDEGLNDVLVRDLLDHIRDCYCHIGQDKIDSNMSTFLKGMDPSLPLSVYTRKQEHCQDFAADAHVPISEATMVTTGTKHAIQCCDFTGAWKEWNRRPDAEKTWPNWKIHWTRAFQENRDIRRLTGSTFRHQANSVINDDLSKNMVLSLDNLANAAIQKNNTVKKLVLTNNQLAAANATLTDHIARLQAQNTTLLHLLEKQAGSGPSGVKASSPTDNTNVWDPSRYCWPHGFKVKKGHTSKTCKTRNDGHQEGAIRQNIMRGSQANVNNTALVDTATKITLLADNAPSMRANIQTHPKSVMPPKGDKLLTTEDLHLLLHKLPPATRVAHRAPGITHSLVSAATLADAGCDLFFHRTGCEISLNSEIILRGGNNIVPPDHAFTHSQPQANSICECSNTQQLIQFYYATMGYPVISTWIKAIDLGYCRGWRELTSNRVWLNVDTWIKQGQAFAPQASHMNPTHTPTDSSSPPDTMELPDQAPNNNKTNMVFMTIAEVDGQLFTDQTGHFSVTSIRCYNYMVIFYVVDANYIKSYPIKSCHRTELIKAYTNVYNFLRTWGYRPQLHKLDNEMSQDVEEFIAENNTKHQYTPPHMHRTNPAERAIRTWKNHFVAIRAGTPSTYRLSNWCKDLEQTDITLNMMRPCTQNPKLSAHKAMEGMFSFNTTPMVPISTECMVHVKPSRQQTWGYHAIKAWYFAPALNHFRCVRVVTNTGAMQTTNTFTFLHHTIPVPTITAADRIIRATKHLKQAVEGHTTPAPDELEAIATLKALITGSPPDPPLPDPAVET
eukprot:CCRYP_012624-RA/>CCRYP_012624-RA protein AED:0.67 eAED:0.42 QI:0/0/0/0.75/0/0/4/0/921